MDPMPHEVCCINRAGLMFPRSFKYWVSWHVNQLAEWAKSRPGPELWSCREHPAVSTRPVEHTYGSSALIAVQLAFETWGFSKVVLAGCPLDGAYQGYIAGWRPILGTPWKQRIRSMSGNTKNMFGAPDSKFLKVENANHHR